MRRPFAREVRLEEEPLDARLPPVGLGQQLLVRRAAEGVAQPRERAGRRQHHAHRVPGLRDGVAERVQACLGLRAVLAQGREDDAGRAERDGEQTGPVDAHAERSRRLVARARDLRRLVHERQPRARELERRQHLVAPAAPGDVEEERAGRVGGVDRALAGEAEADVVLREQDVPDLRVRLRLVRAQPEQLRRREAGERAVAGQRDQPLEADPLLDLLALRRGALVVPEDRGAEHAVVLVLHDEPVHLAGEADRRGLHAELAERRPRTRATSPRDPARPSRGAASRARSRAPRARRPRPSPRSPAPSRRSCRRRARRE